MRGGAKPRPASVASCSSTADSRPASRIGWRPRRTSIASVATCRPSLRNCQPILPSECVPNAAERVWRFFEQRLRKSAPRQHVLIFRIRLGILRGERRRGGSSLCPGPRQVTAVGIRREGRRAARAASQSRTSSTQIADDLRAAGCSASGSGNLVAGPVLRVTRRAMTGGVQAPGLCGRRRRVGGGGQAVVACAR